MRAALLVLLLAAPALGGAAQAAEAGGYRVSHPAGLALEVDVLAALVGRADAPLELDAFTVRAARLRVYEGVREYAVVQVGATPVGFSPDGSDRIYELTDVVVTLGPGGRAGYVGLHVGEGARGSFNASSPFVLESRNETEMASSDGPPQGAQDGTRDRTPDSTHVFYEAVRAPHLHLGSPGAYRSQGPARIKVYGPSLVLDAAENRTTLETGMRDEGDLAVRTAERRWVVLESEDLTFEAGGRTPWEMAVSEARTPDAVLGPEGARLDPVSRLAATAPAPDAGRLARVPWPFLLGAFFLAGAGGGLGLWWRSRPVLSAASDPAEAWDAEDCVRRAEVHLEGERLERALEWLEQARRLAPTSVTACALHACVLEKSGRVDEALAAYAESARLAPEDGEHALCAARLAASSGRGAAEVEGFLAQALARSPDLVEEVDGEHVFAGLRGRPLLEAALRDAWGAHLAYLSADERER